MPPIERVCTDGKGCAGFGWLAVFALVASWPIWIIAVIAIMVMTARSTNAWKRLPRWLLAILPAQALAMMAHPMSVAWIAGNLFGWYFV
jgi:hypothetical protein